MARPSKEYQAFRNLTDKLLTVSKETVDTRMAKLNLDSGWMALVLAFASMAVSVTPEIQSWWAAGPLWLLTFYSVYRWRTHRKSDLPSWMDLHDRFSVLLNDDSQHQHRGSGEVRADHDLMPNKTWKWIVSGQSMENAKQVEGLCVLAGSRLSLRPDYSTMSSPVVGAADDSSRWLYFLVETGLSENTKTKEGTHVTSSVDGVQTADYWPFEINRLIAASMQACVSCAGR